ncbi:MAG: hypothetical protein HS111_23225 [Kofleriaceae bacterium]|nr:hypothetical protein [Kofleriaceae bacterium]
MSRPRVRPWPALRATLAPALFAAALTGCHDRAPRPAPPCRWRCCWAASAAPAGELPRLLRGGTMPARPAATAAEAAIAHVQALAPQSGRPAGSLSWRRSAPWRCAAARSCACARPSTASRSSAASCGC